MLICQSAEGVYGQRKAGNLWFKTKLRLGRDRKRFERRVPV